MSERDALHRRLAWVDTQVTQLQRERQDEMVRRLASLEEAVLRLAQGAGGSRPVEALQPVPLATDHGDVAAPVAAQGGRIAAAPLAAFNSHIPDAQLVCWIPKGSRLAVTDITDGRRTRVIYQGASCWVDTDGLILEPLTTSGDLPVAAPEAARPAPTAPATPAEREAVASTALGDVDESASPVDRGASHADTAPVTEHWSAPPSRPLAQPARPPAPPRPDTPPPWSRPGFMPKLLALVGAAVTLIGVAFLLSLAAQNGLFPPPARTVAAALLGMVLVALAFVVRARDPQNVGAPILGATGVAAGFISVVTATVIYFLLPPLVGVVLAALIGLGGMVLARLWNNEWVGLVSVLGSLLLAVYVGTRSEPVITAGLMLVLTGVTLWFERGTGWRLFPFARVLPTVMVLLQLTWRAGALDAAQLWWLVALTVGLALLGLLSALIAPAEPTIGQAIAIGLLAPMVAPAALACPQLPNIAAAAFILGVVAAAYCTFGFLPRVQERVRWAAVPIGAGFALLAAFTATQHRFLAVLTLGLAVVYLSVAVRTRSGVNLIVGGILGVVGVASWLPLLAFSLDQSSAAAAGPEQIVQSLAGIAVVVLATMAITRWFDLRPRWSTYLSWSVATAMGSVAVIHLATWIGVGLGNAAAGFQAGQAIVTVAWMVLCIVFLRRGLAATDDFDVWLHLALAIAALAVAKLFLLDLGMLDPIARVGAFLAVGLLLLLVGTRYARAWERAHGGDVGPERAVIPESLVPAGGVEDPASPHSPDL
jgi:uncharacterized membrane protein